MGAIDQIRLQLDRIGRGKQLSQSNFGSGTRFWELVDDSDDEAYENAIKGSDISALDASLADGTSFAPAVRKKWFDLHESYFRDVLGLLGSPALASYLADVAGYRVAFEAAEACYAALSQRLPAERVFPRGTRPNDSADPSGSGMHQIGMLTGTLGDPTWEAVDGALPATVVGAGLLLINLTTTTSVTNLVLRCKRQDSTTVDLDVALAGSAQYKQTILGAQAVGAAGAEAGQPVIPVSATGQFKAGEWVLIRKDDGTQEVGQVADITENTSIELETNLIYAYTSGDLVIPLFTDVAWQSGTVTDEKVIGIYAYPDRQIAL